MRFPLLRESQIFIKVSKESNFKNDYYFQFYNQKPSMSIVSEVFQVLCKLLGKEQRKVR